MFLIEFACVCVWLSVQPPAESVQDLGQCVDAPCEDASPPIAAHTPFHAPEPALSSATVPPTDLTLSVPVPVPVPSLARCSSPDPPQTDGLDALLVLGDSAAEEGASRGMATSAPGQAETPMAAVKLESVLDPTELSTVSAERWRSRGRGGRGARDSPRVLQRLNKVNLKKLPDQMCRQDCIALCSVVTAPFTEEKLSVGGFGRKASAPLVLPQKNNLNLFLVILATFRILCKKMRRLNFQFLFNPVWNHW